MVIFHSYVKLPEGSLDGRLWTVWLICKPFSSNAPCGVPKLLGCLLLLLGGLMGISSISLSKKYGNLQHGDTKQPKFVGGFNPNNGGQNREVLSVDLIPPTRIWISMTPARLVGG